MIKCLLIGGQLCNDDLTDLQNWNFPWEDGLCGKIMPQGLRDMENIAVNMKRQLPDFFRSASKDKFIVSYIKMKMFQTIF